MIPVTDERRGPGACTLSESELSVLMLMTEGLRNWEIAATLRLSMKTYANVRQGLLAKLQARTDQHAAAIGFRRRLIPVDRRALIGEGT
jgi:DNA-binding NarL/FixJ family response regulator